MYNYILRAIQALFGHEAEITYTETLANLGLLNDKQDHWLSVRRFGSTPTLPVVPVRTYSVGDQVPCSSVRGSGCDERGLKPDRLTAGDGHVPPPGGPLHVEHPRGTVSTACHGSVRVVRFIIERWLDYDSSGFDHTIPAGLVKWAAIDGDSDWGFHMSNRGRGVRLQVEGYERSRPHQMEARRAPWGWSRGRIARQHRGPGFAWIYRRQILIYWVVTSRVSCLWLYSLESTKYHLFIQVITVTIFFWSSYKELVMYIYISL